MMNQEFERLVGYEVSQDDYDRIIEPMYMATNLSKQEFVTVIDKKRFALPTRKKMVREMRKVAKHLKDTCTHFTDSEAVETLKSVAETYAKRFYGESYTAYICERERKS